MEDGLRHTVKRSLQELSRVLNGDNKTEVVPVFTVPINLGKTNRVELKPTVQVALVQLQLECAKTWLFQIDRNQNCHKHLLLDGACQLQSVIDVLSDLKVRLC